MVSERRFLTPQLIGRSEAISVLDRLADAASEGRGGVALVSGEAGIGKSRILRHLSLGLEEQSWRSLRAACYEEDRGAPLSAVLDLLRVALAQDEATARAALKPYAGTVLRFFPHLERYWPTQAAQGDDNPEQLRLQLFAGLQDLVAAMAGGRPCLLQVEDIHWADEASLEFLLRLSRRVPELPLLLVLSFRDEESSPELERLLSELDRERAGEEVRLARLSLSETELLVRAMLGEQRALRSDLLHALFQLTAGNPFFIEEVVRSVLNEKGDSIRSASLDDLRIPRSVREAVLRRVRPLPPPASELLQVAAVAGVHFDFALLADVTGMEEPVMLAAIRDLIAAQIVVEEAPDQFAFRHALTREAVRSEMLARERRALCRRIGETIERAHADYVESRVEELAALFYEAGDWRRSFKYSADAGGRAMALYSPAAALGHLTRAIDAASRLDEPDKPNLPEVYRLRGAAHEAIGDFDAALADYERAASAAESAGDIRTQWQAALDIGLLWASRDYSKPEPYYQAALELARRMDDAAAISQSLDRLGNWHSNQGDFERARQLCEEALAIQRQTGDRGGVARALDLLGMTCYQGMQLALGVAYYREAIALLEQLDDRITLTSALASLQIASATYQTDMAPPALSLREGSDFGLRALSLARQSGSKSAEAYALWQLAFSLGPQGEYEAALPHANESLAIAREIGHKQWEVAAECVLGALYTDLLAPEQALEHLWKAVALAEDIGSSTWLGQAKALLIDALIGARAPGEALQVYESAATDGSMSMGFYQLYAAGAEAALAGGDLSMAAEMADRLEAAAERSVPGGVSVRVMRLRGRALAADDLPAAIDVLQRGEATAWAQGHLSIAWRLDADLAHARLASGDRVAAREVATRAQDLIDALAERIPDEALAARFRTRAAEHLPAPLRRRQSRELVERLTAREAEIAVFVARGLTSREIADRLVLSVRTVETHIANAMAKLGFTTRAQLAAWAVERGLLAPEA